ncbi:MAG: CcmD family protein [ANME-2 cluster archaeon]|nr:CcmD family protein [ANME-2 cluster archaeon]
MSVYISIFITAMVIWTIIILYLVHMDGKLRKLEKKMSVLEHESSTH